MSTCRNPSITLHQVIVSLEETKSISYDSCCSLHCSHPYFIYKRNSDVIVKTEQGIVKCSYSEMPARTVAHCKTLFFGKDAVNAARAFGHSDVTEALELTGLPSYKRKIRTCPNASACCGRTLCDCFTPYDTDSSSNDDSDDSWSVDDEWGWFSYGHVLKWRAFFLRKATTQGNFLKEAAQSIGVFFSAAFRSLKDLGISAVKAALRTVFHYALEVLKEYLPNIDPDLCSFFALILMQLALYAIRVPHMVRSALQTIVAYVFEITLPVQVGAWILSISLPTVDRQATTQADLDLTPILSKSILGFAAFCMTKLVPDNKKVLDFLIKCDRLPKAIRGLENVAEYLNVMWKWIQAQMARYMGWEMQMDSEIPVDVLNNYESIVWLAHADRRAQIPFDESIREKIKHEYIKFYQLRRTNPSRTVQFFMDKYAGIVGTLMSKVSDSTAGQTENRQKPVVVFIKGGTGVGKSELLYFMGTNVLVDMKMLTPDMTDADMKAKINSCLYPRYVENQYWDAYSQQPICLYDDFGQMTDSPANPNLEFMELIRSANRFPYALHMADISQKNNTFFNSKYIFATTNLDLIDPKSVVDAAAVRSRIDFGYNISVHERFQVNPKGNREEDHKIDRSKLVAADGPTLDIYRIQRWDPVAGNVVGGDISFEEMMAEIKLKRRSYEQHHERSGNVMTNYARQQMRANGMTVDPPVSGTEDELETPLRSARSQMFTRLVHFPDSWNPWAGTPVGIATNILIGTIIEECNAYLLRVHDVMSRVMQKIAPLAKRYLTSWTFFGTLCGLVTAYLAGVFTPASDVAPDAHTLTIFEEYGKKNIMKLMDDSERYYLKTTGKLPPRLISYDGSCEDLWLPDLEDTNAGIYELMKNISAWEDIMDEEEKACWENQDILAPSVLDRIPANRHMSTESGRDLPRIQARVEKYRAFAESGRDLPSVRARLEKKVHTEAFTSKQTVEIVNYLRPNQVWIGSGPVMAVSLAVGGHKILVNRHYWEAFGDEIFYQSMTCNSKVHMKRSEIVVEEFPRGECYVDAVILNMPRDKVPMAKSIWRHFIRKKDLISLKGKYAVLASRSQEGTSVERSGRITDYTTELIELDDTKKRMLFIESDIRSVEGDCGAYMVIDDNDISHKVCGFHFAGMNVGGAMSLPLVYEDFEKIMEKSPELVLPPTVVVAGSENYRHCHRQGKVERGVNNPTKSSFVKTAVHNMITQTEMAPAYLAPLSRVDGPGRRALQKVDQDIPIIDEEKLARAKESFKEKLFSFPNKDPRILTFDEAVQGCDMPFAKGINRSHSAGYPWMLKSTKGKRKWFGNDAWTLDTPEAQEVRDEVTRKIDLMRNGKYEPALYVDTLKDETRDIERVRLQKTRVFSAAPMDYIIIMRMYFLSFFSFVMQHRNDNEISVGTQCQSPDWDRLTRRLLSNHGGIIAGDFSNFDGTLHSQILCVVRDVVNEWYDDGPENAQIRNFIFEDVVHSWHVTEKDVNSWNHSQPSGNPGTAIFNSMYNSLIMRMCYYDLEPENEFQIDTFNTRVVMVSYGDDNVLSVRPSASFYNQDAISEAMKKYGMTYTLETKGEGACTFREIGEVQYLQRFFRYEPKIAMWVAPLKARSINERLNWNKKTPSPYETLKENAMGAIAEWALHEEDEFCENTHKIQNVLSSKLGMYVPVRGRGYYLSFVRSGTYGEAFPATSYA